MTIVTLESISNNNIHAVMDLQVSGEQKNFYPRSNAYSIAEGTFPQDDDPVWMRAICRDGVLVGFMMTSEVPLRGEYFLWRLMIDRRSQGKGYGARAMELLIQRVIGSGNANVLLLSHMEGNLQAARFFAGFGFTYTGGRLGADELEMSLRF